MNKQNKQNKQNKHDENALNLLKAFRLDLNQVIEGIQTGKVYYPHIGDIRFNILNLARDELVMARYSEGCMKEEKSKKIIDNEQHKYQTCYQPEINELDDNNPPQEDSEYCIKEEKVSNKIKVIISHDDLLKLNRTPIAGVSKNLGVSKILKDAGIPVNTTGYFLQVNTGSLKKTEEFDAGTITYTWTP